MKCDNCGKKIPKNQECYLYTTRTGHQELLTLDVDCGKELRNEKEKTLSEH